jgi:acyl transferase domain-containing protein
MTQEGASLSMGTPTVETEAAAMTAALKDAGVNPNDVEYLEAHGTGTCEQFESKLNF